MVNLYESLKNFHRYTEEGWKMGKQIDIENTENIVITGMGGSAISGNILEDYLRDEIDLPIYVNRSYDLPSFADEDTLLFVISYSGETEETLSSFEEGKERGCKTIFITSNEEIEAENKVEIPDGLLPRASLPYLFFSILKTLEKSNLIESKEDEVEEVVDMFKKFDHEKAKVLADRIKGKIPIVYSPRNYSSISYRWQTELNENSKIIAHHNTFTELNHNEIEGNYNKDFFIVILKDREVKSKKQIELSADLISEKANVKEIELEGNKLTKIFHGIYWGDWVSYYLGELRNVSIEETENIDRIKEGLD